MLAYYCNAACCYTSKELGVQLLNVHARSMQVGKYHAIIHGAYFTRILLINNNQTLVAVCFIVYTFNRRVDHRK